MRIFQKILCFLIVCSTMALSDSIELRNGRHLQGKFIGGTANMVGFMTGSSVQYFSTADVLALIFDNNSDLPLSGLQPQSMERNTITARPNSKLRRLTGQKTIGPAAKEQLRGRRQITD